MQILTHTKRLSTLGLVGAGLTILALSLFVSSVKAFERIDGEKYLVIAGRQPADVIDPAQKYDQSTRMLQEAMYDSLVRFTGKPAKITPLACQELGCQ